MLKEYASHNPFLVFALAFAGLTWLFRRGGRSPTLRLRAPRVAGMLSGLPGWVWKVFAVLGWVCVGWFVVFEAYYGVYWCATSARYHDETILIARRVIGVLEEEGIEWWADFATLLSIQRGQSINEWDHDTDISILFPPDGEKRVMDAIAKAGLFPTWDPRDAIQIMPVENGSPLRLPHMDIWFWRKGSDASGRPVITTGDGEASYPSRLEDDIFPLKKTSWKAWPGKDVWIPNKDFDVSEKEYGHWPGSIMVPVVYKADCFHNWFQRRWLY